MSSNLKVNNILPSTGDTVAVSGIASVTSSVSIASSCTATTFYGSGANLTNISTDLVSDSSPQLGGTLDANSNLIKFGDSNGSTNKLVFGNGNDIQIRYQTSNLYIPNTTGDIVFETGGGEKLRIDSTGHLHVKGTDHEVRWYRDAGDRYGAITYDGGQFNIKNPVNDNTNVTKSDGTLHTRFLNSGHLQIANGNLVISNAGSGIDFSAAGNAGGMTSELLDDYEEGSWTPSVTIETRPASDSPIDSVQGNYIKVGGLVHAFGQFTLNGTPSERSTGRAIELRNFPFTHNYNYDKVGGDIRSSGHLINSTYGSDIYFVMRMINGAAYCRIEIIEQGYAGTRNASPVMTDNMNVGFSFTYSAA